MEQGVEDFYGPRGARAMLMRVGRELVPLQFARTIRAARQLPATRLKNMPLISAQAKMKILLQQIVRRQTKTSTNRRGWKRMRKIFLSW